MVARCCSLVCQALSLVQACHILLLLPATYTPRPSHHSTQIFLCLRPSYVACCCCCCCWTTGCCSRGIVLFQRCGVAALPWLPDGCEPWTAPLPCLPLLRSAAAAAAAALRPGRRPLSRQARCPLALLLHLLALAPPHLRHLVVSRTAGSAGQRQRQLAPAPWLLRPLRCWRCRRRRAPAAAPGGPLQSAVSRPMLAAPARAGTQAASIPNSAGASQKARKPLFRRGLVPGDAA